MGHKEKGTSEDLLQLVQATTEVMRAINLFYQDEVIVTAIERIPALFQVKYTAIFLYDEEDNTLFLQHHTSDTVVNEKLFAMSSDNILSHAIVQESPLNFYSIEEYEKERHIHFPPLDFYRHLTAHCIILTLAIGRGKDRQLIGVLVLSDRHKAQPFSELEQSLAIQIGEILSHSLARTHLSRSFRIPGMLDSLTEAIRWHPFYELFAREVHRARRYQSPLSLLLLDIDDLRAVNQKYGMEGGDYILKETAKIVNRALRTVDIVSRKESCFYLVLPETRVNDAMIVAERLRKSFQERSFPFKSDNIVVKISLGVVEYSSEDTPVSFINKGKLSLDHAKEKGGNQIVVYHIMKEALEKFQSGAAKK